MIIGYMGLPGEGKSLLSLRRRPSVKTYRYMIGGISAYFVVFAVVVIAVEVYWIDPRICRSTCMLEFCK